MGSVNNQALVDKLHNLNSTQQSIETVSAWCSFYRKDARKVVAIWEQEFIKMSMAKQLAMAYLANDILQNSRKKGPEFCCRVSTKRCQEQSKHLLKTWRREGETGCKTGWLTSGRTGRSAFKSCNFAKTIKNSSGSAYLQAVDRMHRSSATAAQDLFERLLLRPKLLKELAAALHRIMPKLSPAKFCTP